jgi:hypothetical protein
MTVAQVQELGPGPGRVLVLVSHDMVKEVQEDDTHVLFENLRLVRPL